MDCHLCNREMHPQFRNRILNKYEVQYYYCENCGYLCTEKPYWLEEAYADAIVSGDTGILVRNHMVSTKLAATLFFVLGEKGQRRWLDYAGGYGIMTRLMRDTGFDFSWSDKYSKNLLARGFEITPDTDYFGVTAIEALEHAEDPKAFIQEILQSSGAEIFIFTTELFETEPPPADQWWYYVPSFGQHVSFFQRRTLQNLAEQFGMHFYSASGLHFFSKQKLPNWKLKLTASGKISRLALPFVQRSLISKTTSDAERWLG